MIASQFESHQPPPARQPSHAKHELERSIRVLGSVALALAAAARQREQVRADVAAARQTLHDLVGERELAEATVAAAQALIDTADKQLKLARARHVATLHEVEQALRAAIERRKALDKDVAALAQRRHDLASAGLAERARRSHELVNAEVAAQARRQTRAADSMIRLSAAAAVDVTMAEPILSAQTRLDETTPRTALLPPTVPRTDTPPHRCSRAP